MVLDASLGANSLILSDSAGPCISDNVINED